MPLTLITGPANAGKAGAVLDAVRAHHAGGEEPLLVVPTRADVERYRGELARGGLVLGVRVQRFEGLLAEIVRRAGRPRRPLGRLARRRVLAVAVEHASSAPATPGLVRALDDLVAELQVARVTPARLRAALRAWTAADPAHGPRALWLGECYEEYHRVLSKLRRVDAEQQATRALDALRETPARWGGTPVALYGFDDLTELQLDAIETLAAAVGAQVAVSLAFEPGRTAFAGRAGTFQALLPLACEHRGLGPRAEHYAAQARGPLHRLERFLFESQRPPGSAAGGAVRLLEGAGERAELELIAQEIAGLLERGVAPREIAVVHRSPGRIAELLGEVFGAYRIPFALERRLRFGDTAVGRALLGLLAAAVEDDGGQLADLLAWLRAPGVLRRPELADELEAQARRAGVSTAAGARALWEGEHRPLETLDRLRVAAAGGGAVTLIEHAIRELQRLFCGPRLRQASVLEHGELAEARALAAGCVALEELRELADLAPGPRELIATLRELELVVGEEPRGAQPDGGVAVLHPLELRARRVRALFLCDLQEGVFPLPARAAPLLSEEDRRALAQASGLLMSARGTRSADALAAERYLFYAAVSRPEELLVLSWHTVDDNGLESSRSLFVDDVCDLFTNDLQASHDSQAADRWFGGSDGGLQPLRDARVLAELRERPWSASSLEAWAGCPTRWFVERLLGARDLEPEAEPLARGGLAHAVLRDTLEGLRRETGSARLTAAALPRARRLLRAALRERGHEFPLSVAPERVPGVRRRLEADLERYLEHAVAWQSPSSTAPEPTHLELSFGFPDEPAGLPALELGEGVRLRGRIDRVDVDAGGAAVVYDYKGARAPEAAKWASEGSFQVALYMRAVEELLGTQVAGGFYQPLSGRDLRARGVLALDEGLELSCVRGDARPRAELQELLGEVVAGARAAAAQARAGALEARPQTCGFGGGGCMYPTICRCEP